MDWEAKEKERIKALAEERVRLLAMSEGEAEKLPTPDRYQRMRYQREIQAAEWLEDERRKLPVPSVETPISPVKQRYSKASKVIFNHD